jgi:hypothetical protein
VFGEVVAVDICICDVVTPAERSALEAANTIDDLCWDLALLARSKKERDTCATSVASAFAGILERRFNV